ncbi:MAG: Ig-like domain-containing protein [Spirochaetales bacterium]|uniref:Ig-like domain-containing protein n=1 Tax=Candidatus Thalassospirochaeta sargassi TaxID=3119039 RepID=A0AAJ1IEK6_9SPIO|nr:Ig-like domain-containing protein [Spirochaetales bacterium]
MSSKLYPARLSLLLILLMLLLTGCGIIDITGPVITTYPSEINTVVGHDQPLTASFSEAVDQIAFEDIYGVEGPAGQLEGDFEWDGLEVVFSPLEALSPGAKYRLKIDGIIKTINGGQYAKYVDIPFYYQTDEFPPVLLDYQPMDCEFVDTKQNIRLEFSKTVDTDSLKKAFSLSPADDFIIDWDEDNTTAVIKPETEWQNLQFYSWQLSTELLDTLGISAVEEKKGSFLVQCDSTPPEIISIHPAECNNDGSFFVRSSAGPDELNLGEHLAIIFSEAINFDSLTKNFSLTPSPDGYLLLLTPETVLYYIDEDISPGENFDAVIRKGLEDGFGNASTSDWKLNFTPDIRPIEIEGISIEDSGGIFITADENDYNSGSALNTAGVEYIGPDSLHFIVTLSEVYTEAELNARLAFESDISLTVIFPPGTGAPKLFSTEWETNRRLRLIYKALVTSTAEESIFYRFKIQNGDRASANISGSYLTESIEIILPAALE